MSTPYAPMNVLGKPGRRTRPPGIVAGAVLRSARRSAGLSTALLAAAIDVDETTITLWEGGSEPLASVSSPVIEELAAALRRMGAQPVLVADLFVAAWCDLVLGAIDEGDDARCLLADPLARDNSFSELLAWAMSGQPPARHRPYASAGQLL
jgi:transcriptional regulator with XRE-family HTH domain